jgi:hypothetical protein
MFASPENCPARCVTISVSGTSRTHRLDLAADHDEDRQVPVADVDEHLAAGRLATPSVDRDPRDLVVRERREDAVGARDGDVEGRRGRFWRVHRDVIHARRHFDRVSNPARSHRIPDSDPWTVFLSRCDKSRADEVIDTRGGHFVSVRRLLDTPW